MTSLLVDECVCIDDFPREIDDAHRAVPGAQITMGDLHGNALKLIYTLVRHGIVTNLSAERYSDLVSIYKMNVDSITRDDILQFNTLINYLEFNTSAKLRLLGDELSDRGSNDYFTLKILDKLHEMKVPFEIILSNHGMEFIQAYESTNKFLPSVLENHFAASMINMQILIAKKLITRDEVNAMIKTTYKPSLKAISYTMADNEITIYSHAPIDLSAIRALAAKFSLSFDDSSPFALAKSIDAINVVFSAHVIKDTVHSLYIKKDLEDAFSGMYLPANSSPIEFITWNRELRYLNQPEMHKGYKLNFAHGHDSEVSVNKNVFNLDNRLGKTLAWHTERYTALYSFEYQLSEEKFVTQEVVTNPARFRFAKGKADDSWMKKPEENIVPY
jgi:hypothetical protein